MMRLMCHPLIVELKTVLQDKCCLYLVTELLGGGNIIPVYSVSRLLSHYVFIICALLVGFGTLLL